MCPRTRFETISFLTRVVSLAAWQLVQIDERTAGDASKLKSVVVKDYGEYLDESL